MNVLLVVSIYTIFSSAFVCLLCMGFMHEIYVCMCIVYVYILADRPVSAVSVSEIIVLFVRTH